MNPHFASKTVSLEMWWKLRRRGHEDRGDEVTHLTKYNPMKPNVNRCVASSNHWFSSTFCSILIFLSLQVLIFLCSWVWISMLHISSHIADTQKYFWYSSFILVRAPPASLLLTCSVFPSKAFQELTYLKLFNLDPSAGHRNDTLICWWHHHIGAQLGGERVRTKYSGKKNYNIWREEWSHPQYRQDQRNHTGPSSITASTDWSREG